MFEMEAEEFCKDLHQCGERFAEETKLALRRVVHQTQEIAQLSGLFTNRTYRLFNSIKPKFDSDTRATLSADAPYAGFMENGTRAHFIFPVRAKALRFVQNGQIRFAAWVFHPGTKSRPFMQHARDKGEVLLEQACQDAACRAFE